MLFACTPPINCKLFELHEVESNNGSALRRSELQLVYIRNAPPAAAYILSVNDIEPSFAQGFS